VDRQSSDRLGRRGLYPHRLLEHWRKILCASPSNAYTHADRDCDADTNGNINADSECYGNGHCCANCYRHTYAYFDTQTDTDTKD
jgi:hypothetical protein